MAMGSLTPAGDDPILDEWFPVAGDLNGPDSSCFTRRAGIGEFAKSNRGRSITMTAGPRPENQR
jgi:hypothetical protein